MRIVLADLKSTDGFVNKDTVVGGFGLRFRGFSFTTRWAERIRKLYQNLPSIHIAYLAAIFRQAGHDVVFTDRELVDGDLGLVLTSIVDYRNEIAWAERARVKYGMKVGFFGALATHSSDVLEGHADFIIKGEPEEAAMRLARGDVPSGIMRSQPLMDLDTLPFPAWNVFSERRGLHAVARSLRGTRQAFPLLASRSCPEFCTYCPHRTTAPYRSRSPESVLSEIEHLCRHSSQVYLIFRDPLFSEDRSRAIAIAEGIGKRGLPVHFECETRLDSLDTELLDVMYAGGLRAITFGVESIETNTLKHVGRRPIPPVHQKNIIEHCRKRGIVTEAFYVFGFLEDTFDTIKATIRYAIDLNSTIAMFKVLTPYPGTPLRKRMEALITEVDLEKFDGYTLTFQHPNLTRDEMIFLLGAAYNRFYVRPSWLWNYLGMGGACGEMLRRFDEYAFDWQLSNEALFLDSQPDRARIR